MIDKFIAGHYYRWNGPRNPRPSNFNSDGLMNFLLDGKPHLCKSADLPYRSACPPHLLCQDATFEDQHQWNFSLENLRYFAGLSQLDLP